MPISPNHQASLHPGFREFDPTRDPELVAPAQDLAPTLHPDLDSHPALLLRPRSCLNKDLILADLESLQGRTGAGFGFQ